MTSSGERPTVLIVEDDKSTREGLSRALHKYRVLNAESGERALGILNTEDVDVLLSDLRMPGMDGLTLLQRALASHPHLVTILLTAYGNVETAVEAMKKGAFDFLTKPVNLDHLELLIQRALRSAQMENENTRLRQQLDSKYGLENIIGNSPAMLSVFDVIRQAAPTQATVLIQGPSGTGKELVAHAIHQLSPRSRGPFVAVHCAALSPTLLESELFGHEKGAFTGATARRRGRFEQADGGTLFLDEVSEIDSAVQVKLLRILEEHTFERVGGNATVDVDMRLVAATNRNLKEQVERGLFREDLYFRLDVVTVNLPPLRERPEDISLLCHHFIGEFNRHNEKQIEGITADAVALLATYDWPGNVRELRNTIEKMAVLSRNRKLTARDVPPNIREHGPPRGAARDVSAPSAGPEGDSLANVEKHMILDALSRNGNNRTLAARQLGISRRTLHRKLKQYRQEKDSAPPNAHARYDKDDVA